MRLIRSAFATASPRVVLPRWKATLALLLALSLALPAAAQASPSSATSPAEAPATAGAPPPATAPDSLAPRPWHPWEAQTAGFQVLGGASGAIIGGMVGMAMATSFAKSLKRNSELRPDPFGLGARIGGVAGIIAGTWAIGTLRGGYGSYGWTGAGAIVGVLGGYTLGADAAKLPEPGLGLGLGFGLAGAILGYHASADANAPSPISAAMRVGTDGKVHAGVPLALPYAGADGKVTGWQLSLVSGRF